MSRHWCPLVAGPARSRPAGVHGPTQRPLTDGVASRAPPLAKYLRSTSPMLALLRLLTRIAELSLALPARIARSTLRAISFPQLGPARYVIHAALAYVVFSLLLVYVVAPVRGVVGAHFMADKLRYDAERWVATAIYDRSGSFVGTFDPRLDSARDVNFTDQPIEVGDYVANPDHKSIPVAEVPDHYWRCLLWHEDRYLGGPLNPYGIDLLGVLKIPYSTVRRSLALKRAEPRRRWLDAADAVRARDLQDAAVLKRERDGQARPQAARMVAGAGDLPRADTWWRLHAAQAVGGQPHLAGATDGRSTAARRRGDEPHRVRQGSARSLGRGAVRAGVRRQQADHPADRQRQAQRGSARPLALHRRGAGAHLRGKAHHRRGACRRRCCSS